MLISETLFGTRDKVQEAIDLLKKHEPPEGYYLAFSGGKDSICVLDLAKKAGVKFDSHYNLTTVDPPELVRFIKTFPEVEINRPKYTMWQLIPMKFMPPTRLVRYCCDKLKEGGGAQRVTITGIRSDESSKRKRRKQVEKPLSRSRSKAMTVKLYVHPIFWWSESEVWDYIDTNNLAYCSLYDNPGYSRIGCLMCPMASIAKRKHDGERYPKIYHAYLRSFGRMIERRKIAGLETKWQSSQEVMDWWLSQ
jgi:phosphoadenosine phosphosulfate reductase